jgi:alanine racemase
LAPFVEQRSIIHQSERLRDAWVEVDLTAIQRNAIEAAAAVPEAQLLAIVKANAYGLGAVCVAKALRYCNTWGYGVGTADEGAELRAAGIDDPILVLRPPTRDELGRFKRLDLRPTIESVQIARCWEGPFHLAVDTGMGRIGVRWNDDATLQAIRECHPEGIYTHFYAADEDTTSVMHQLDRMRHALRHFNARAHLVHVANSAGIWRAEMQQQLLRPGIFLYGGRPGAWLPQPRNVVAIRSRVVSLRTVPPGDTVSYGGVWRAVRRSRVATLGIGYADGIPRSLSDEARVLVRGVFCPVIGRITMDMTMLDVTEVGERVQVGDVATIIGSDGENDIRLDQFADWAGTISYVILTRMGHRLDRIYGDPLGETPPSKVGT